MKTRNIFTKLIAITMAVAAIAVIGTIWMAGRAGAAGRSDINDTYVFRSIIGITSEQSLRVSVGNTANTPGSTVTWTYKVTNTGNVSLYESEWIEVPPEQFRISDVLREDLNTEGEPVTRRAQLLVTVTIRVPAGSDPKGLTGSLEVVNTRTGSSYVCRPYLSSNNETCTHAS